MKKQEKWIQPTKLFSVMYILSILSPVADEKLRNYNIKKNLTSRISRHWRFLFFFFNYRIIVMQVLLTMLKASSFCRRLFHSWGSCTRYSKQRSATKLTACKERWRDDEKRSPRSKRSHSGFGSAESRQVVAHLRLMALLFPQPLDQGFFGAAEEWLHRVRDVQGLQLRYEDVALEMRSAMQTQRRRLLDYVNAVCYQKLCKVKQKNRMNKNT